MRRQLLFVVAAMTLFGLSACKMAADDAGKEAWEPVRQTNDRLSQNRMEDLAGSLIKLVEREGLAAAELELGNRLEAIREAKGAESLEEADLLMSFAVLLYSDISSVADDETLRLSPLPWLDKSIEAYRVAVGPDDPNVAVAFHSRADLRLALNGERPTADVVNDLEEALRIRLLALGPRNIETLATRMRLADLRSDSSPGGNASERLAKLRADYAIILRDSRNVPADGDLSTAMIRFSFARALKRNGELVLAEKETDSAMKLMEEWPPREPCIGMISVIMLARDLAVSGILLDELHILVDQSRACINLPMLRH